MSIEEQDLLRIDTLVETYLGSYGYTDFIKVISSILLIRYLSVADVDIDLPKCSSIQTLLKKGEKNLSRRLTLAIEEIYKANENSLDPNCKYNDFESRAFGPTKTWDNHLYHVIQLIQSIDFESFYLLDNAIFGRFFRNVCRKASDMSGSKSGGGFYTPESISNLMASLTIIDSVDSVYDPACGSGGLLIDAYNYLNTKNKKNIEVYGQDSQVAACQMAKLNMIFNEVEDFTVVHGDTFSNPGNIDSLKSLVKFDAVISNPPFSMSGWRGKNYIDEFSRFEDGIPPANNADYAFILHSLACLKDGGRCAVVVSSGALFREQEKMIRKSLIEGGKVSSIINLPVNIFDGTSISANVIVLEKYRSKKDVLFIDASKEFCQAKPKNILSRTNIDRISDVYWERLTEDGFSRVVDIDEISNNDFNLNVSRYIAVDKFEASDSIENLKARQNDLMEELNYLRLEFTDLLE